MREFFLTAFEPAAPRPLDSIDTKRSTIPCAPQFDQKHGLGTGSRNCPSIAAALTSCILSSTGIHKHLVNQVNPPPPPLRAVRGSCHSCLLCSAYWGGIILKSSKVQVQPSPVDAYEFQYSLLSARQHQWCTLNFKGTVLRD